MRPNISRLPTAEPPVPQPDLPGVYRLGRRWVVPEPTIAAGDGHTYVARGPISEGVERHGLIFAPSAGAARDAALPTYGDEVRISTVYNQPEYDYGLEGSDEPGTDRPARRSSEPKPMSDEQRAALNEAREYAKHYTGRFDFMLEMRERVTNPTVENGKGRLSERQVAAILRCKLADEESAKREAAERTAIDAELPPAAPRHERTGGLDLSGFPTGRTYAAVDNDAGGVTFLIIDRPDEGNWAGWTFVKQQISDNEVRLGSARPGSGYRGEHPHLVARALADIPAAVIRYGIELGRCGVCGRTLTNEESRAAGIGPDCASKIGGI